VSVGKTWRALVKIVFCCVVLTLVSDCCLSSSISVSPTKIEAIMRGDTETFLITVANPSIESVQVDVKCMELAQTSCGVLSLESDPINIPWVSVYPESFELEAFERQVVSVTVEPVSQGVAGTYCAITFTFSSLLEGYDRVHSRGQIISQLILSGPDKERILL
jgi:hypothetical protein